MTIRFSSRPITAIALLAPLLTQPGCATPTTSAPKTAAPIKKNAVADAPAALSPAASRAALGLYQQSLDQLSAGHPTEARATLEEAVRRYGNRPEWNLLLAYLLGREGHTDDARRRLNAVAPVSPLAASYASLLGRGDRLGTPDLTLNAPEDAGAPVMEDPASANKARLAQSDARLIKFESSMAGMVNDERRKNGLAPLSYDPDLAEVARAHSAEMRDKKYFAHESPTTALREPLDRYVAGLNETPLVVAENIYRAWGSPHAISENDIKAGHTALMNSPGHRANILYPNIARLGIGIVADATGNIWITQMFARS